MTNLLIWFVLGRSSDTDTTLAMMLAALTFWILVDVSNREIIQIVDRTWGPAVAAAVRGK